MEFATVIFKSQQQIPFRPGRDKTSNTLHATIRFIFSVFRPPHRIGKSSRHSKKRHIALQITSKTLSGKRNPLQTQNRITTP
ncbi:hypothetical protein CPJ18_08835 [Agrobacterium rosae]|uniref:Uncharacterized protein n=1 Tax=Agrobacterium rosae TaxID=1972867 RepID=A0AAE5VQF6_9HYPH|nr:hypothetical protein DXM21_11575 [Agrobacterium rosae]KAA3520369.1 hypothetical protein DXM25_12045 [Agrobacterium rosae]MQB48788.1 hypothetical protein [Agrobacterium rosae]POO52394.1 hypothetical protein CPJ18_08835 [Agrobacterium rosae]